MGARLMGLLMISCGHGFPVFANPRQTAPSPGKFDYDFGRGGLFLENSGTDNSGARWEISFLFGNVVD